MHHLAGGAGFDEDLAYDAQGRQVEDLVSGFDASGAETSASRQTWTFGDSCP